MNDCGISKLDLKRRNRMQILKVVREQGPISRVDISAILGITRAAVTIITNEMIDQHILQEVGEEPVNPNAEVRKGRRKILLDINETYKFAIGIYVDEKEISIGLTTLNAAALDKKSITHKADMTPEALAELLGTTLEKMLQNSCLTYENLLGIGVGIMPSAFEMMGGSTTDTGCPAFPVLQKALEDSTRLPVYINSAVTEFAMAGVHYGDLHAKAENQVFLYWDSGSYRAIPVSGNAPILPAGSDDAFVEHICVNPAGARLEGYPKGRTVRGSSGGKNPSGLFRRTDSDTVRCTGGRPFPSDTGFPAGCGRNGHRLAACRRRNYQAVLRHAPYIILPVFCRAYQPVRFRLHTGASGTDPQSCGRICRQGLRTGDHSLPHRGTVSLP